MENEPENPTYSEHLEQTEKDEDGWCDHTRCNHVR